MPRQYRMAQWSFMRKEVIGYKAEPSCNTFYKGDTGFLQTEYVLQLPYFDTTIDTLCHLITGIVLRVKV